MRAMHGAMRYAMMAGAALTVSACGQRTPMVPSPPAADVEAAAEAKPVPPVEIVTDEAAAVAYDEALEAWGERVSAAGRRVCLWLVENGGDYVCER